jgi:hypothetical protein
MKSRQSSGNTVIDSCGGAAGQKSVRVRQLIKSYYTAASAVGGFIA